MKNIYLVYSIIEHKETLVGVYANKIVANKVSQRLDQSYIKPELLRGEFDK